MKKNILLCMLAMCVWSVKAQNQDTLTDAQKSIVVNNNRFALSFLSLLNKEGKLTDFAFSPFSLSAAFAMVYAGSANDTEKQLKMGFGFGENNPSFHQDFGSVLKNLRSHNDSTSYQLAVSNVAFIHEKYKIKTTYESTLIDKYAADLKKVDFTKEQAAKKLINDWGSMRSKGMIKEMLTNTDPNAMLLLANLAFLEASWSFGFSTIKEGAFYTGKDTLKTLFMHKEARGIIYAKKNDWTMVGLPIKESGCSLLILMPDEPTGLDDLINKPSDINNRLINFNENETSKSYNKKLPSRSLPITEMTLILPKFELESKINPTSVLQSKGILNAFMPTKADFSNMTGAYEGLYISVLEHNCHVIVNEKGVKASASTAVLFSTRGGPREDLKVVNINKPFVFFVRDDATKAILFVGKVTHPITPK